MTLELPSAAACFRTRIDSLMAERHDLQRRLEDAAAAGDEGDRITDEIAEVDRDLARTKIKLEAADRAEQAQRDKATALATAAQRKVADNDFAEYERAALRFETVMQAAAEAHDAMQSAYMQLYARGQGAGGAFGSVIKPAAVFERVLQSFNQQAKAARIKDPQSRPFAVSRRFPPLAELFATKRQSALSFLKGDSR